MKKTYYSLFLICLSFLSFKSFATVTCDTYSRFVIFSTDNGIFKDDSYESNKRSYRTKTWEECFTKAIEVAKNIGDTTKRNCHNGYEYQDCTGYNYVTWRFQKGLFAPEGKVTGHTSEHLSNPEKGDQRFHRDGQVFFR